LRLRKAAKPASAVTENGLRKRERFDGRLDFNATLLRIQYLQRRFGLEPTRAELVPPARVRDDGRAEAALIAVAGIMREMSR
jgi:hypothetical protein